MTKKLVWSKKLMDGGNSHSQKEWAEHLDDGYRLPTANELFEYALTKEGYAILKDDPYLMTSSKSPITKRALVLGVYVDNDGFYINAYDYINNGRPARGVRK